MILLNRTKSPEYIAGAIIERLKILNSPQELTKNEQNFLYNELKHLFRFSKEIEQQQKINELKRSLKQ